MRYTNTFRYTSFLLFFLLLHMTAFSQVAVDKSQELFKEIAVLDSLIFKLGYNHCDTVQFRKLLSDDFEFYHDIGGLTESKEEFIENIPSLCNMNYKATRKLLDGSMKVFPLYSDGDLYGVIQLGIHEFYGEKDSEPKYLTSTAKFTHVWILEGEDWKLKRILSYDHVTPLE